MQLIDLIERRRQVVEHLAAQGKKLGQPTGQCLAVVARLLHPTIGFIEQEPGETLTNQRARFALQGLSIASIKLISQRAAAKAFDGPEAPRTYRIADESTQAVVASRIQSLGEKNTAIGIVVPSPKRDLEGRVTDSRHLCALFPVTTSSGLKRTALADSLLPAGIHLYSDTASAIQDILTRYKTVIGVCSIIVTNT